MPELPEVEIAARNLRAWTPHDLTHVARSPGGVICRRHEHRGEVETAEFGDKRLTARLVRIAEQLAKAPDQSFPKTARSDAALEATYRFFGNESVTPAAILQPHVAAAAFELGRRGAWAPPRRGERCLDPQSVYELMRPLAHAPVEEFHVVLLDVRGRLLRTERIAQGSLTQCPVNPRDVFRTAVREAAHGIVFVHNHPSGDAASSPDDVDLTERLRAAAELVGVLARDHVIVASGGYYSFVEAGRWRR